MGPLHKRAGRGGTHNNKLLFPLLSNKDKFSRHLSNKQSGWGGTRPGACRIATPTPARWRRVCSFALPPWALRPRRAKKGQRRCHSRAPRPVATPAGPSGGRDLQAPGRAAPGEEGGDRQGLPHPARSPGTREPCRRPGSRTCRPAPPPRRPPSLIGLRLAGLTASAARRPSPPSCTTSSFFLFPPAPPRAATSATTVRFAQLRGRSARVAPPLSPPRPAPSGREATVDKLSRRARER